MDPDAVESRLTRRTKAIMAVHLYGGVCAMDRLVDIARKNGLFLIEDCAEALGSRFNGEFAGTFGDVSTFSFYGNKTITTGEGGMVATRAPVLHGKIWKYKSQGLAGERDYWHDCIGFNYRMTNICAAIGWPSWSGSKDLLRKSAS